MTVGGMDAVYIFLEEVLEATVNSERFRDMGGIPDGFAAWQFCETRRELSSKRNRRKCIHNSGKCKCVIYRPMTISIAEPVMGCKK